MLVRDRFLNIYKRDLRESTRNTYRVTLDKLYNKFNITEENEENKLKNLTCDDLEDWCLELEEEYKGSTYNTIVTHLREYFKYLTEKRHLLTSNPFDVVQKLGCKEVEQDAKEKYIPNLDEIRLLIIRAGIREKESIKTFDFYGARDKAIMSILATTGTRQSVIRELRYEWIEEIDGGIAFNVPKEYTKNKTLFRMVIGNKTLEYFNNYLKIVKDRNIESEYIFTSIKGNKLTLSDMDDMFKKTIKKARIDVKGKSCSCHCMRNALVTYLVKRGDVSETVLKEIFNWSKDTNSNMIERYSSKDVRAYDEIKLKILNII